MHREGGAKMYDENAMHRAQLDKYREEQRKSIPWQEILGENGDVDEAKKKIIQIVEGTMRGGRIFFSEVQSAGKKQLLQDLGFIEEKEGGTGVRFTEKIFDQKSIDAIPENNLREIVKARSAYFREAANIFEKTQLPEMRKIFLEKLENSELIQKDIIDIKEAGRRLEGVEVSMFDMLNYTREVYENGVKVHVMHSGKYDGPEGTVLLSYQDMLSDEQRFRTLFHELTHVIFGKKFAYVKQEAGEEVVSERYGVEFLTPTEEGESLHRFTWMNEAITEEFSQTLLPDMPRKPDGSLSVGSYFYERRIVHLVKEEIRKKYKEVDLLFLRAVSEQRVSDKDTGVDAWRALSAKIRDAFAPGFLVRLDEYIKKYGPKATMEVFMERGWEAIYRNEEPPHQEG